MKIEPLGDWKFKMTSPVGDVVIVQVGENIIAYSDPHPRITVEEHDQLVQYQISVDGHLTPLKTTRACQWLVVNTNKSPSAPKKVWAGGVFHTWITDEGRACAIVEEDEGRIRVVPAKSVRMVT